MKKVFSFILVLYLSLICVLYAQWVQTNGPYGGNVNCFAYNGSKIFAGTVGGGIFVSTNNGINWIYSGLKNNLVTAIATQPNNEGGKNIYVATGDSGVFVSRNNGLDWTEFNNGLPKNYGVEMLFNKDSCILAATTHGNFRTFNNSNSWTEFGERVYNVLAFAKIDTILFVGTESDGVFYSNNNGNNFIAINNGFPTHFGGSPSLRINSLATIDTLLFAGTTSGVYRSDNKGISWIQVDTGITNRNIKSLHTNGNYLYAGTNGGGAFISTDFGLSWAPINNGLDDINVAALISIPDGSGGVSIFAGTDIQGIFLSTDNGSSWSVSNKELANTTVLSLIAVPDNNGRKKIFAGTYNNGVFLSTDEGVSWTKINLNQTTSWYISDFIFDGTNIFAASYMEGIFYSNDLGVSWEKISTGPYFIEKLAKIGTSLFVGTQKGILVSTDSGITWTQSSVGIGWNKSISCFAKTSNEKGEILFFAGTGNDGVFISTDIGKTWTAINNGLNNLNTFDMAVVGINIFVSTQMGIYTSTSPYTNWTRVNKELTNSLFTTGGNNLIVYCPWDRSAAYTFDDGKNWYEFNTGLSKTYIYSLTNDSLYVLAGSVNNGVLKYPISKLVTGINGNAEQIPVHFKLEQNYPNPFNPNTKIKFSIPKVTHVTLKVYDALGSEVATLINEKKSIGDYIVDFNSKNLSSGIYFYKMKTSGFIQTKKMILVR